MHYRDSLFPKTIICAALAVMAAPALAQNTTSSIAGRITTADGKPVAGAEVTVLHKPSGTTSNSRTDADGRYIARGLRAGGPYNITIKNAGATETQDDVFLPLAETFTLDAQVGQAAQSAQTPQSLGQVVVRAPGSIVFNRSTMGTGTSLSAAQLRSFSSVQGNLQDYARLDPRISQTDKERGEISVAGQNSRYNAITVDGMLINDPFGLEANNLPFIKQPISMEAIQSAQINVANYDVTQKGYTGANINAVSLSGTNALKGSVYYKFRNDSLAGKRFNRTTETYIDPPKFKETELGLTLGGPIISDTLFFFFSHENFKSTRTGPEFGPLGGSATNVGIRPEAIAAAQNIAQTNYAGLDIGSLDIPSDTKLTFKTTLAKLSWNITDGQRANLRYTKTDQTEPIFPGFNANSLSLNSHWYDQIKSQKSVLAELFSDWRSNFSTELKLSKRDYASAPDNNSRLPQVSLNFAGAIPPNIPATSRSLLFGTERSRQFNDLGVKTLDAYGGANWLLGEHDVKFGFDYSKSDIFNAFLQNVNGNYTFACIPQVSYTTVTLPTGTAGCTAATTAQQEAATLENFLRGRPSSFLVQVPAAGRVIGDGAANWTLKNTGLFAQDSWTFNDQLTLMFGARIDKIGIPDKPIANAAAAAPTVASVGTTRQSGGFGLDNTTTPDGKSLIQPRVGFNFKLPGEQRSQVRGGFGLFQGAAANVWLSNPFSNTGVATRVIGCGTLGFPACIPTDGVFSADPDAQPNYGGAPAANVDFVSKDLKQPSVWKINLAFERELSEIGLVFGAELLRTRTKDGIYYQHLNLGAPTAAAPDGRQMFFTPQGFNAACWNPVTGASITTGTACTGFRSRALNNPAFNDVLLATSTDKGAGNALTLSLTKPTVQGFGWSAAYTRSTATEVSPLTSSTSTSNWAGRSIFNPNEETVANSSYLTKNRLTGTVNWERAFFGTYKTQIGVFYEGREGKPYSWTFNNDANGDGLGGNDLMYIPSAPGSGEVIFVGDTATSKVNEDKFWAVVNANYALNSSRGKVVKRNTTFSPFVHNFDVRVRQELPGFFPTHKAAVVLDLLNVGNMLNKKWGRIDEVGFQTNGAQARSFVNYAGLENGKYRYSVVSTEDFQTRQARGESQWAVQVTLRYDF